MSEKCETIAVDIRFSVFQHRKCCILYVMKTLYVFLINVCSFSFTVREDRVKKDWLEGLRYKILFHLGRKGLLKQEIRMFRFNSYVGARSARRGSYEDHLQDYLSEWQSICR